MSTKGTTEAEATPVDVASELLSTDDANKTLTAGSSTVPLSQRGLARLEAILTDKTSIMNWLPKHYYDAKRNPKGMIVMAIAENQLMASDFINYIKKNFSLHQDHLKYHLTLQRSFVANTDLAVPFYINDTFFPLIPVTSENSVVGPGVGTLITEFFWQICDVGDAALVTAPFYGGFEDDTGYPSGAQLIAVDIPPHIDPLSKEAVASLEIVLQQPSTRRIRALILCNPHNPLGRVYPTETIIAYAELAEKYDLHLLVDEIYGNQVYSSTLVPNPPPFISVLSLDLKALAGCNPARVHVVAGPSKDFGASGLRIGIFISQANPAIVKLLQSSMVGNAIANSTDAIFTTALTDRKWRNEFLEENRRRVGKAYDRVVRWCNHHSIPVLPSYAGQFAVLDMGSILDQCFPHLTAIEQRTAAIESMASANVLMWHTGKDQKPTRFRMVFVSEPEVLTLALLRLETAFHLSSVHRQNAEE